MKRTAILFVAFVLSLSGCAAQKAQPGPAAQPPSGYVDFCERSPLHYACRGSVEDIAFAIHTRALSLFDYAPDAEQFYRQEHWQSSFDAFVKGERFTGDCDDFVLTLMDAARHMGIPLSKIALVYCKDADGLGHLVLMLDGRWILDNQQDKPKLRVQLPRYEWLRFMTLNRPNHWNTFARSMTVSHEG